jgi:branched-chain amino acid transport system substrate-binding protein
MRRSTLASVLFTAIAVALSPPSYADSGTLKIGAPQPMTGPDAPFGDKFKKAYALAVEEINAAGGINGKKIEISRRC